MLSLRAHFCVLFLTVIGLSVATNNANSNQPVTHSQDSGHGHKSITPVEQCSWSDTIAAQFQRLASFFKRKMPHGSIKGMDKVKAVIGPVHRNCRNTENPYRDTDNKEHSDEPIKRVFIADEKLDWSIKLTENEYKPKDHFSKKYKEKRGEKDYTWVDSDDPKTYAKVYNKFDKENNVDRTSVPGPYLFDIDGRPLNPFGRTGIKGWGAIGRWGPSHAADAIVAKYIEVEVEEIVNGNKTKSKKKLLHVVLQKRKDNGKWAMPGGFVDPNNAEPRDPSITALREFIEEVLNHKPDELLNQLWKACKMLLYDGYIDDERNTDNAWMVSKVYAMIDRKNKLNLKLEPDPKESTAAKWVTVAPGWPNLEEGEEIWEAHMPFIRLFAASEGVTV
ncbi:NUDIX domain-containing protein [Ditylenchus destructor]|uniref:NUDIX domain-containing protein n=1 Tax=Ditylenchus destructor TaxID=166010 RepID=A0AAD4MZL4_9BILA|nr:NUDIX domain-containing protein [Ditylenchus destructor]